MLHVPVLLKDVLNMAQQVEAPRRFIVDATFGRGGHTKALSEQFPEAKILGVDCDAEAIEYGKSHFAQELGSGKWFLHRGNFADVDQWRSELPEELKDLRPDLILLDLGVSSPQLDQAGRGFSFYHEGELDMRMDQRRELTAADIVNTATSDELHQIFHDWGEVLRPGRVIQAILKQRDVRPFSKTRELSELIERVEGWRRKGHHPATRYFMALRIAVNSELAVVEAVLPKMVDWLAEGGRLMVITFHSLEDRIVKLGFKALTDHGRIVNKKVIQATWAESKSNPRARSAKLRVFEKGGHRGETTGQ